MTNEASPIPAPQTPVEPGQPKQKSRKALWITLGVVGGLVLISGVNAAARGGDTRDDQAPQEVVAPAAQEEVALVTIPDVSGQTVADAKAALQSAGLTVTLGTDSEADDLVLSTRPLAGTEVKEGSSVTITAEVKPQLTLGQENAVGKAEDYLRYTAFSRSGLIGQLEFEGFATADATFAVDYLAPDWNAQAAAKAKNYLDMMSFSRQGLIDQLIFEGFSQGEAEFGVAAVGY